jgi:hypothetical protein
MTTSLDVGNVQEALAARSFPTVTMFNRLEGRPRTVQFDRALRAEVRDALWMLTKQWQMGEFRGDDSGSPVLTRLLMQTTRFTKYEPSNSATEPFPFTSCLNTQVERRPIPLSVGGRPASLALRLAMGRYWLKLIAGAHLATNYAPAFTTTFGFIAPDPTNPTQADVCAHLEMRQLLEAVAGRSMDGGALYLYLSEDPAHHAYDGVAGVQAADRAAIDARAARFVAWFKRTFSEPNEGNDAWQPSRLEYGFSVSAPMPGNTEKVYVADEYYQGRLDWYSLDVDGSRGALGEVPGSANTGLPPDVPRSMIASPISFAGMPNTRWWAFEDRATNFGDIDAATTDLAKLLFIEFALVYSNDWFVLPYSLPLGSVAQIQGMVVTNTFGERQWIEAAGSAPEANWQQWSLFSIDRTSSGLGARDNSLVLLPTAPAIQQGEVLEDVMLIRDESANMVWAIEKTICLPSGEPKRGIEAARESLTYYEGIVGAEGGGESPAPTAAAPIRYTLMSTVPENWIPFIPVHVPNSNREIQLQRASMPRIIGDDPASLPLALRKVKPQTVLLGEGLDANPAQPYFIFEEEVSRAGIRVFQSYQRTRTWGDDLVCGRIANWLRITRQTGRGEGSSGLAFDTLADVTPSPAADSTSVED